VHHFGCRSDGLRAAGLPTLTVEHELPRRERVATALALLAAGESVRSIAEQLSVHLRTAHRVGNRWRRDAQRRPRPRPRRGSGLTQDRPSADCM
jgi:hypothetical protein